MAAIPVNVHSPPMMLAINRTLSAFAAAEWKLKAKSGTANIARF